ncbi:hypothetical protein L0Y46_04370 [bacterium]|nr:hypothetical protein [bacterium]
MEIPTEVKTAFEKKKPKERFSELLEGRFADVVSGNFKSLLPGIKDISIIKGPADAEGRVKSLSIIPSYEYQNDKGEIIEGHVTLSLFESGVLSASDRDIANLGVSREDLYNEALNIIERINLDFFEQFEDDILPPGNWPPEEWEGDGEKTETSINKESKPPFDPRRIEFMEKQKGSLFAFSGKNSGFRGYYGYAFPNFIVLENDKVGNAAYILPTSAAVTNESRLALPTNQRMTKEERRKHLSANIFPLLSNLTKKEAIDKFGKTAQIPHPKREQGGVMLSDDEWEKRWESAMQEAIEKMSARTAA